LNLLIGGASTAWRAERRRAAEGLAAAVVSAGGLWLGNGLEPIWWLMWIAPWPALLFALRGRTTTGAAVVFAAWFAGGLNLWSYLHKTIGVPAAVPFLTAVLPAAVVAGGVCLARRLAGRGRWTLAVLALPAAWTSFELACARLSPHGSFGSLAVSQADFLPVVQLAAVGGGSAISFLLFFVASAVAVASRSGAPRRRIGLALASALALALGYGTWRLSTPDGPGERVTVGLAASDQPRQPASAATGEGQDLQRRLADAVASLHASGARIIVLPETTLRTEGTELEAAAARLAAPLDRDSVLVVGVDRVSDAGEDNAAIALGPGGRVLAIYRKRHLLPPFERHYRPGTRPSTLRVGTLTAGLAICKDLDFPALGRENAREGAAIVLAPAWDFEVDGWLHSRMAVLRGVESGFALARAARSGRLTVSDSRGRVLAEARSDASGTTTLLASVPVGPPCTVYSRRGDWLGWLGIALLATAVAAAFRSVRP